jgi:hypothetical protein
MAKVFLSYSKKDHYFAELARIKLEEKGISVWVDSGQLRAGDDWRSGIDKGISECLVVLLALSKNSSESSYVTYEWASAMGKGKPLIPIRLDDCSAHPKIEPIQYLDFSTPGQLPWSILVERVNEIEQDIETLETEQNSVDDVTTTTETKRVDPLVTSILEYLNQRGFQKVSFDRIRRQTGESLKNSDLEQLIKDNKFIFRKITLNGGKPGMAKL